MIRYKTAVMAAATAMAVFSPGAQAQTASGKFTCDAETYTIESAVAAWIPADKSFVVWAFTAKLTDDELKAYAFVEGSGRMKDQPKALSDKAFQKVGWDAQKKAREGKSIMLRGSLKESAQKVEWKNADRATLMYVNCLKNANLNFNMYPGDKNPKMDIAKAFKSFDFPLKDGAKVKYQTIAFSHAPNPKGIDTKTTWDYKVDTRVYVLE